MIMDKCVNIRTKTGKEYLSLETEYYSKMNKLNSNTNSKVFEFNQMYDTHTNIYSKSDDIVMLDTDSIESITKLSDLKYILPMSDFNKICISYCYKCSNLGGNCYMKYDPMSKDNDECKNYLAKELK